MPDRINIDYIRQVSKFCRKSGIIIEIGLIASRRKDEPSLDKFYLDDKSYFTRYWPFLSLLFIGAILAWWQISSLLAAVLAAAGFIFIIISDKRGKKKERNSLEILDKGIIFNDGDQSTSISYTDIKKVKYSNMSKGTPTIIIETSISKKRIQLSDYDRSNKLLQQLEKKFTLFNCPIVK